MNAHARFDREARIWDNPGRAALSESIVRMVCERIPLNATMSVMDFGAGTGLVTLGLCPLAKKVVAVDASIEMLKVLNEKAALHGISNIETVQSDIAADDLDGYRFDLIVSAMTMHHVSDIAAAIKKFHTLLNKNGYLAIADLDLEEGDFHPVNEGIFHYGFDRTGFMQQITAAGFSDPNMETAFVVKKETSDGTEKEFPVFLVTAVKK